MTDNEIKRERTFDEELSHFNKRIKEVFDNYHNPNGGEDRLEICVLRDAYRTVRKAEEEINRQQAEYNNLLEQFRILDYECGRLEKADENQKAEIEKLKGYPYAIQAEVSKKLESQIKSEAVKEFAERLKDIYKVHDGLHLTINNLVKEMVGDNNESV